MSLSLKRGGGGANLKGVDRRRSEAEMLEGFEQQFVWTDFLHPLPVSGFVGGHQQNLRLRVMFFDEP